jgi:hypothetical protein
MGPLAKRVPPDIRPAPVRPLEDRATFAGFRRSQAGSLGFIAPIPESELRNQFNADGNRVGAAKTPDWVSRAIGQGQVFRRDYSNIRVPVLAMLEFPALRPTGASPQSKQVCHRVGYLSASQFSKEYSRFFRNAPSKDIARLREEGLGRSNGDR